MREWGTTEPFDLVVAPCSSFSHLLTLDDQLAAWRCVAENLRAGASSRISPYAAYHLAVLTGGVDAADAHAAPR